MKRLYHDGMAVTRQERSGELLGRANQKLRTRTAIITAAQAILDRGETPTVAQAAEEALVSRTTAWRYFPNQESLLVELYVNIDTRELAQLVERPLGEETPQQRVLELLQLFNQHVLANERLHRTAMRLFLDTWLHADAEGERSPSVREGRRTRLIATALEPLRGRVDAERQRVLEAALCLVAGGEAIAVMRDVCRLGPDEALQVTGWAAQALVDAALPQTRRRAAQGTGTGAGPSKPTRA
jgi:AcrR family transcriptional regulator